MNSFPVFTKFGKVKITISLCDKTVILSENEIQLLEKFHKFLFADTLHIDKEKCFSSESAKMSYYVVPVNKGNVSLLYKILQAQLIINFIESNYQIQGYCICKLL